MTSHRSSQGIRWHREPAMLSSLRSLQSCNRRQGSICGFCSTSKSLTAFFASFLVIIQQSQGLGDGLLAPCTVRRPLLLHFANLLRKPAYRCPNRLRTHFLYHLSPTLDLAHRLSLPLCRAWAASPDARWRGGRTRRRRLASISPADHFLARPRSGEGGKSRG